MHTTDRQSVYTLWIMFTIVTSHHYLIFDSLANILCTINTRIHLLFSDDSCMLKHGSIYSLVINHVPTIFFLVYSLADILFTITVTEVASAIFSRQLVYQNTDSMNYKWWIMFPPIFNLTCEMSTSRYEYRARMCISVPWRVLLHP